MAELKDYAFVIKLAGSVSAKNEKEAWNKINSHVDDLGNVESAQYDLHWPDVSWDLEYEL
jgi:hypothetical protein